VTLSRSLILLAIMTFSFVSLSGPAHADPVDPTLDAAGTVTLRWTAPGDDGNSGRATAYDLRYSTSPITAANFSQATQVSGEPAPAVAGSAESFIVSGLTNGVTYYFAIKTRDEANNWSTMSNTAVRAATVGVLDQQVTLGFSAPYPNPSNVPTRMEYALPVASEVRVDAYDIMGRHVRTLLSGFRPAGRGDVKWDLKDDQGRRVQAGVYLVRGKLGDRAFNHRVTIIQ
jgi:hypothetical protein